MNEGIHEYDKSQVLQYLKDLDLRISRLETRIGVKGYSIGESGHSDTIEDRSTITKASADESFGENWFANLAIIVFSIFFTYFIIKPYEGTNQFFPPLIGLIISVGIISVSKFILKSFSVISRSFYGIGFLLLYISFLRLFHFSSSPALNNELFESILLLGFSSLTVYVAIRKKSNTLSILGVILLSTTSLLINIALIHFLLLTLISLLIIYCYLKLSFTSATYLAACIFVVYFAFAVWTINNPIVGNNIEIVKSPLISFYFLLFYMVLFAYGFLGKQKEESSEDLKSIISYINALTCFIIFVPFAFFGFRSSAVLLYLSFSVVSLSVAVLYWRQTKSKYSTYIYALLSFVALSLAIIAAIKLPTAFIPLIWQSLIVIVFAIWFNSKGIVVSNFVMFILIFTAYLLTSQSFSLIGLSFGAIALISARLLNWQKKRLTLKTEMMRNIYLIIAFLSIPFTMIKSLPENYVGLSLILLSSIYYVLSAVLSNIKYRWMAHFTLLGTMIYVLIFLLGSLDNTFQVITLLTLTIALISVSIFFNKMKINAKKTN